MSDERPCIRVTDSFELKEDNPHGRNCLNRLRLPSLFHIKHEYQESLIQGRITINRPRTKTSALVVITTAQVHSTKLELRFCAGSNPTQGVSEIRDGEDL